MVLTIRETKCKFIVLEETKGSIFLLFSEICLCLSRFRERRVILTQLDVTKICQHGVLECQSETVPATVVELSILDDDREVQQFGFNLWKGGTVHSHLE